MNSYNSERNILMEGGGGGEKCPISLLRRPMVDVRTRIT